MAKGSGGGGAGGEPKTTIKNFAKYDLKKLGITAEQAVKLAGIAPGSRADITGTLHGVEVHSIGQGVTQTRLIERRDDRLTIKNEFFKVAETGTGRGTALFAGQVAAATAAGVTEITTYAARGSEMNGYYTWPRLGYDRPLSASEKQVFERLGPRDIYKPQTVLDVMVTPAGREYWSNYGAAGKMTFDLTPGSRSLRTLREYQNEKRRRG